MTVRHVIHGSYYDAGQRRFRYAGTKFYDSFSFPPDTKQAICRTRYALSSVRLYSGALIDRIYKIGCRSTVEPDRKTTSSRVVNVGGTGGFHKTLSCNRFSTGSTIDGMFVRSGSSLDQVSFHCLDEF